MTTLPGKKIIIKKKENDGNIAPKVKGLYMSLKVRLCVYLLMFQQD